MSDEKSCVPPNDGSTSLLLVSIANGSSIQYALERFPESPPNGQFSDYKGEITGDVNIQGISASFLFSGKKGKNIPVNLFCPDSDSDKGGIGFVMNHSKLDVPFASFHAYKSGSMYRPSAERDIVGSEECDGFNLPTTITTAKFPQIKGCILYDVGDERHFWPNFAKWQRSTETFHNEGRAEIFAEALWRKYFKEGKGQGIEDLHEVCCWKKTDENNPVMGLFIRIKQVTAKNVNEILYILQEQGNEHLKLYLYNEEAKEDIVKFCDNQTAIQRLTPLVETRQGSVDVLREQLKILQTQLTPTTQDVSNPTPNEKKQKKYTEPDNPTVATNPDRANFITSVLKHPSLSGLESDTRKFIQDNKIEIKRTISTDKVIIRISYRSHLIELNDMGMLKISTFKKSQLKFIVVPEETLIAQKLIEDLCDDLCSYLENTPTRTYFRDLASPRQKILPPTKTSPLEEKKNLSAYISDEEAFLVKLLNLPSLAMMQPGEWNVITYSSQKMIDLGRSKHENGGKIGITNDHYHIELENGSLKILDKKNKDKHNKFTEIAAEHSLRQTVIKDMYGILCTYLNDPLRTYLKDIDSPKPLVPQIVTPVKTEPVKSKLESNKTNVSSKNASDISEIPTQTTKSTQPITIKSSYDPRLFNGPRRTYVVGTAIGTGIFALTAAEATLQIMASLHSSNRVMTGIFSKTPNEGLIAIISLAGVAALITLVIGVKKVAQHYYQETSHINNSVS